MAISHNRISASVVCSVGNKDSAIIIALLLELLSLLLRVSFFIHEMIPPTPLFDDSSLAMSFAAVVSKASVSNVSIETSHCGARGIFLVLLLFPDGTDSGGIGECDDDGV